MYFITNLISITDLTRLKLHTWDWLSACSSYCRLLVKPSINGLISIYWKPYEINIISQYAKAFAKCFNITLFSTHKGVKAKFHVLKILSQFSYLGVNPMRHTEECVHCIYLVNKIRFNNYVHSIVPISFLNFKYIRTRIACSVQVSHSRADLTLFLFLDGIDLQILWKYLNDYTAQHCIGNTEQIIIFIMNFARNLNINH